MPGALVFLLQKSGGYARINMRPGQYIVQGALPVDVGAGFEPGIGKGAKPVFIVESLRPGIEFTAQFPGAVDNPAHLPVAP